MGVRRWTVVLPRPTARSRPTLTSNLAATNESESPPNHPDPHNHGPLRRTPHPRISHQVSSGASLMPSYGRGVRSSEGERAELTFLLLPSFSIRTRLTLLKKASTTEYIQPKDVESIYHAVLKQGKFTTSDVSVDLCVLLTVPCRPRRRPTVPPSCSVQAERHPRRERKPGLDLIRHRLTAEPSRPGSHRCLLARLPLLPCGECQTQLRRPSSDHPGRADQD